MDRLFFEDTVMEQDRESFDGLADGESSWFEKIIIEMNRKDEVWDRSPTYTTPPCRL